MTNRWPYVLVFCLLAVGCVRETTEWTPTEGIGALGDPCFDDKTCNEGFECQNDICVVPGQPLDAGQQNNDTPQPDEVIMAGAVEKGPFILGTSVDVSPVNNEGEPTGEVFTTSTINNLGEFNLNFDATGFVSLEAGGFYYNEISGGLSNANLTLRAYHDVGNGGTQNAYINLVTHLSYDRVKQLVSQGTSFESAVDQAEMAVKVAFNLQLIEFSSDTSGSQMNILGGDSLANAYLFAVSAIVSQAAKTAAGESNSVDAQLQQLINQISIDLAVDGEVEESIRTALLEAQRDLDVADTMSKLSEYLSDIDDTRTVPDLNQIIDSDLDGIINANDNCPFIVNVDQLNNDGDEAGDACDSDDDNDEVDDEDDIYPMDGCASADYDEDGDPDALVPDCTTTLTADNDNDNDGVANDSDACALGNQDWTSSSSTDHDSDGCQDDSSEDTDDDNDGVADGQDACALGAWDWTADASTDHDSDGCQDAHAEDGDDDNDGVADAQDDCSTGHLNWTASAGTDYDSDGCKDDEEEDADDDNDSQPDDTDDCPKGDMGWTADASTDNDDDGCQDSLEDTDDDNDSVLDGDDAFIYDACASEDDDGDGAANTLVADCVTELEEDFDDDGDGVPDVDDDCPVGDLLWGAKTETDHDDDGCQDSGEDLDDDNDGAIDEVDDCAKGDLGWLSSSETDYDLDGCQDSDEDLDDDNDGVEDDVDDCALGEMDWVSGADTDNDGDGCRDASSEDIDIDNDGVFDGNWFDLDVGGNLSCGIQNGGILKCWGSGIGSDAPVLGHDGGSGDSPQIWRAVSTSENETCGITSEGQLLCWGVDPTSAMLNNNDEAINGWRAISLGGVSDGSPTICGIRLDGSLYCSSSWNSSPIVQSMPTEYNDWISVSTGLGHACAIRGNGELFCWGDNQDDKIEIPGGSNNLGGCVDCGSPSLVISQEQWVAVSAGFRQTCGIKNNGHMICWGGSGEWGENYVPNESDAGTNVDISWTAVSAGDHHTCGLRSDGQIQCWGAENADQSNVPNYDDWVKVSAGGYHSCGMRSNGEVLCWGNNEYDQLDVPTVENQGDNCPLTPNPDQNDIDGDGIGDACDDYDGDGTYDNVDTDNDNDGIDDVDDDCALGELDWVSDSVTDNDGDGCRDASSEDRDDDNDGVVEAGWFALAMGGYHHACGIHSGGILECWGRNEEGQLNVPGGSNYDGGVPASEINTWFAVTAADTTTCGLYGNGNIKCWGEYSYVTLPVSGNDWLTIDMGGDNDHLPVLCGIRGNGELECGGSNTPVLSEMPENNTNWTAIQVGVDFACGLRGEGELICWGNPPFSASSNVLGDQTKTYADTQNHLYQSVSIGGYGNADHMCAVRKDGVLECFGWLGEGIPFLPPEQFQSRWERVSTGSELALGILDDGTLQCWHGWGSGGSEQGCIPPTVGGWVNIRVSEYSSEACGIDSSGDLYCWGEEIGNYGVLNVPNIENQGDNCPLTHNPDQNDMDGDGIGDACDDDNHDGDEQTDAYDDDDDNDGIADEQDDCPLGDLGWVSDSSTDHDSDGCQDNGEDLDNDNDGVADEADDCDLGDMGWVSDALTDYDSDGCQDSDEDLDDDNDGIDDVIDDCAFGELDWVSGVDTDNDGDGCRDGSLEDVDIDNDGVANGAWLKVAVGHHHACGLYGEGLLECWGEGTYGETQVPEFSESLTDGGVSDSPMGWVDVAVSQNTSCGILEDGVLNCWGANPTESLLSSYEGDSNEDKTQGWAAVSVGGYALGWPTLCGIRADGSLVCTAPEGTTPLVSEAPENNGSWKTISVGDLLACGLRMNGEMVCWGDYITVLEMGLLEENTETTQGADGGVSDSLSENQYKSLSTGDTHVCAIRTNGVLDCWGAGIQEFLPQTHDEEKWVSVSSGYDYSCGVMNDGSIACWGTSCDTENDDAHCYPPEYDDWVDVGAGHRTACGIRSDGSLHCWGDDTSLSDVPEMEEGDNCPLIANPEQEDMDGDGIGDACDDDDDNDGIADDQDDCPLGDLGWEAGPSTDHDGDGCQDSGEDLDDDNDGVADEVDNCDLGELDWVSDAASDYDSDGCRDGDEDNCPYDSDKSEPGTCGCGAAETNPCPTCYDGMSNWLPPNANEPLDELRFSRQLGVGVNDAEPDPDEFIVVDSLTQLQWHGCLIGLKGANCETTTHSGEGFKLDNYANHSTTCDESTWGGYFDWRMPTIQELASLSDYYYNSTSPSPTQAFPELLMEAWSASQSPVYPDSNHTMWFNSTLGQGGNSFITTLDTWLAGICVRAGNNTARCFQEDDSEDEDVIIDATTNLMWQKSYWGKDEGPWQLNIENPYHFPTEPICENNTYGGYNNWRMPSITELSSLMHFDGEGSTLPALFPSYDAESDTYIWSNSPVNLSNPAVRWVYNDKQGTIEANYTTYRAFVRCVRNYQETTSCSEGATDTDTDGTPDCLDNCPTDENKTEPGMCGCGVIETEPCPICYDSMSKWLPPDADAPLDQESRFSRQLGMGVGDTEPDPDEFIVVDSLTQLQWRGCLTGLKGANCETSTHSGSGYQTGTYLHHKTVCDYTSWGGYSDWRMPTIQELASLPDYYWDTSSSIPTEAFPELLDCAVWSASNDLLTANANYGMVFHTTIGLGGLNYSYPKFDILGGICVRAGETQQRCFEEDDSDENEVVVIDNVTNLMWQKGYWGHNGSWIYNPSSQADANYPVTDICGDNSFGGFSDWRIPSITELMSLMSFEGESSEGIPPEVFDIPIEYNDCFWSKSLVDLDIIGVRWIYTHTSGHIENKDVNAGWSCYVRCVRDQ